MNSFSCTECNYSGEWSGLVHHDRQSDCNNDLKEITVQEFKRVVNKINKVPTREEFDKHSRISKNSAVSNFDGSYNNLIIEAGFHPNKSFKIEKEDLIKEIRRLDDKYSVVKRELMRKEGLYSPDTCEDRFGSWNNALEESGVGINKVHKIDEEEYLEEIKRLKRELEEVPSGHQMNDYGKYSAKSYNEKFGTYNKAVRKAGYEPKYEQYADGEDSHAYGITGEDHPRYGKAPKAVWKENEKTGNKVRSNWEYEYDNLLYETDLDYFFEEKTFKFGDSTYLPDFFVENEYIIEIKGWANDASIKKASKIMKELDDKKYIVVGSEASKQLECDVWFSWDNKEESIEFIENSITGV